MSFVIPADAKSWVEVTADSHFPIQNLPFVCYHAPRCPHCSIAVRIGDYLLDLNELCNADLLPGFDAHFACDFQEPLEDGGRAGLSRVREVLYNLLKADNADLRDNKDL